MGGLDISLVFALIILMFVPCIANFVKNNRGSLIRSPDLPLPSDQIKIQRFSWELPDRRQALVGGFCGTLFMTALLQISMRYENLDVDFASMLASAVLSKSVSMGSPSWIFGLILHFLIGTVILSLIYKNIFFGAVKGSPSIRGLKWGFTLWFVFMFFLMPLMGKGFFGLDTPKPILLNLWVLAAHILYGMTLGLMASHQAHFRSFKTPVWHG